MTAVENDMQRLPLPVRALNSAGRVANKVGFKLIDLHPEKLLKQACKNTGLDDYGEDSFREALAILVQSLDEEGKLTLLGRNVARSDLMRLLENRLQIVEQFKRHPEISEERISRPLFIVGPPRSGTTIQHELLALDPANRVPQSWETSHPMPPPDAASYLTDPRIAETSRELERVDALIPEFKKMHRMGATLPQECVSIFQHDFRSMIADNQFRVPSFMNWLIDDDMSSAYRQHRQFLQLLQWKTPGQRWVLKSPQHLWYLDALLDEYPDACIVQTHRDPVRVMTSISNLVAALRKMSCDNIDLQEIAGHWSQWLHTGFERTIAVRESGRLPPEQVIDVHFQDFMGDTIGTFRRIYDHFGYEFSDTTANKISRYLEDNPANKHGKHLYSFADTGMDLDKTREYYSHYQNYFDIAVESV